MTRLVLTLFVGVFLMRLDVMAGYDSDDAYENQDGQPEEDENAGEYGDETAKSYGSRRRTAQSEYDESDEDDYHSSKKVFVPIYVPDKIKKKMKILSVNKGFYIPGGTQLAGKFKSLKHCMKACALTPSCFAGDFNPWLHKCYQHTNFTACSKESSHPQYVHFSKVPCTITDAPQGHVTLGAASSGGIEIKGIDSLTQCIKKCTTAGTGIQATVKMDTGNLGITSQSCFAIDFDFSTGRCFFFGSNYVVAATPVAVHCISKAMVYPSSLNSRPNPNVIHITFCPTVVPAA